MQCTIEQLCCMSTTKTDGMLTRFPGCHRFTHQMHRTRCNKKCQSWRSGAAFVETCQEDAHKYLKAVDRACLSEFANIFSGVHNNRGGAATDINRMICKEGFAIPSNPPEFKLASSQPWSETATTEKELWRPPCGDNEGRQLLAGGVPVLSVTYVSTAFWNRDELVLTTLSADLTLYTCLYQQIQVG